MGTECVRIQRGLPKLGSMSESTVTKGHSVPMDETFETPHVRVRGTHPPSQGQYVTLFLSSTDKSVRQGRAGGGHGRVQRCSETIQHTLKHSKETIQEKKNNHPSKNL